MCICWLDLWTLSGLSHLWVVYTNRDVISEGKQRAGDSAANWQQRGCHWVVEEHCSHVISLGWREKGRGRGKKWRGRVEGRGSQQRGIRRGWRERGGSSAKQKAGKDLHTYADDKGINTSTEDSRIGMCMFCFIHAVFNPNQLGVPHARRFILQLSWTHRLLQRHDSGCVYTPARWFAAKEETEGNAEEESEIENTKQEVEITPNPKWRLGNVWSFQIKAQLYYCTVNPLQCLYIIYI